MVTTEHFVLFYKDYLSQWQHSPFQINDLTFTCAEQAMMYGKATLFEDDNRAEQILASGHNPRHHQQLGRLVSDFEQKLWDEHKYPLIYIINYLKFSQNPELCRMLFDTGSRTLVEASPVDKIWGVGLSQTDHKILNPDNWKGQNLLGFAITSVRDDILSGNPTQCVNYLNTSGHLLC